MIAFLVLVLVSVCVGALESAAWILSRPESGFVEANGVGLMVIGIIGLISIMVWFFE